MLNKLAKAQSKKQQQFMGMVVAYKRGELGAHEVSKEIRDAAKSMTMAEAEGFAETKHRGLPMRVKKAELSKAEQTFNKYAKWVKTKHQGKDIEFLASKETFQVFQEKGLSRQQKYDKLRKAKLLREL